MFFHANTVPQSSMYRSLKIVAPDFEVAWEKHVRFLERAYPRYAPLELCFPAPRSRLMVLVTDSLQLGLSLALRTLARCRVSDLHPLPQCVQSSKGA
eukprot:4687647-Amphidinium_carterae.1